MSSAGPHSPKLSIGISFHNNAAHLPLTLRSIFAQTLQDWELILVDDGSSDGSLAIAQSLKDERVRLYSDGQNRGLGYRLNQITELARAPYIARMDADDLMHPDRFKEQLKLLEANPEADLVHTSAVIISPDHTPTSTYNTDHNQAQSALLMLRRGGYLHPTIMGRKRWFERFPYDPTHHIKIEDRELFLRSFAQTRVLFLNVPYYYYVYAKSLSKNRTLRHLNAYVAERKLLLKYGPPLIGWPRTLGLYGRSLSKSGVVWLASAFGVEGLIKTGEFAPIDEGLAQQTRCLIESIKQTPLPQ